MATAELNSNTTSRRVLRWLVRHPVILSALMCAAILVIAHAMSPASFTP